MLNEQEWQIVAQQVNALAGLPGWAGEFCVRSLAALGKEAEVRLEEKECTPSYLDFLREQIHIGARGEEWTDLLKRRLSALEGCVGKRCSYMSVSEGGRSISIRFDPDSHRVIVTEAHGPDESFIAEGSCS